MDIFGVHVEPLSYAEVSSLIEENIENKKRLRIATVNPEFLLLAREDEHFKNSLQKADIRTTDGVGIVLLERLFGKTLSRVTGASLTEILLALAHTKNIPVVIYNHKESLSSNELIEHTLKAQYPELTLLFNQEPKEYSIVLCAHGAPAQEFLLDTLTMPGIFMGAGGSIDYLTGKQKRAPLWARKHGLEWFFRMWRQPHQRLRRIWRAVIVFPLLFLKEKMVH